MSALVVTAADSMERLVAELSEDLRLELGAPLPGFLPIVATTDSLRSSRLLCEELRARAGVEDVQLVSWTDDHLIFDADADECGTKETL